MRYRIRFSLRTLFATLAAVAGVLGYLSHCRNVAARQSQAIARFEELGASFQFAERWQGPYLLASEPCHCVTSLETWGDRLADEDLALLADLPDLERIALRSPAITDAAVPYLAKLDKLTALSVLRTQIAIESLAKLPQLPQLKCLVLGQKQALSSANIATVMQCSRLECLAILYGKIRAEEVLTLATLPHLNELALSQTGVPESVARRIEHESDYRILVVWHESSASIRHPVEHEDQLYLLPTSNIQDAMDPISTDPASETPFVPLLPGWK